jgi:hypothetical protein
MKGTDQREAGGESYQPVIKQPGGNEYIKVRVILL